MCVIAVKYFDGIGWVGAKNRDRNYQPKVNIVQSNRTGVQRLYIDDALTRYTEGLNEYGVCILSAALSVKNDEKEAEKKAEPGQREDGYMSPDGKIIRDALLKKNVIQAYKHIIEKELAGCTVVFDKNKCFLIEGGFTVRKKDATEDTPRKYIYKVKEITQDIGYAVRTNHGIYLPQLGYQKQVTDAEKIRNRKSSDKRLEIATKNVLDCKDPEDMMNALAVSPEEDKFMNPIRLGNTNKGDMVTTGQLQLVPAERTMHYRPLYSQIEVNYSKLNGEESKTFFEIISSKNLLGFKEFSNK